MLKYDNPMDNKMTTAITGSTNFVLIDFSSKNLMFFMMFLSFFKFTNNNII
jgi:hypothetical protein